MTLTTKRISKLTEAGRYGDGRGLYLQVTPSGVRSWILRFERNGHERMMGLGPLADFTLDEARDRARKARQQLKDGVDPIDARRAEYTRQVTDQAQAVAKSKTFEQCAQLFFDHHSVSWKNKKHISQFNSTLAAYVFPKIGRLPVAEVDRNLVLACVQPIWADKNATAVRGAATHPLGPRLCPSARLAWR